MANSQPNIPGSSELLQEATGRVLRGQCRHKTLVSAMQMANSDAPGQAGTYMNDAGLLESCRGAWVIILEEVWVKGGSASLVSVLVQSQAARLGSQGGRARGGAARAFPDLLPTVAGPSGSDARRVAGPGPPGRYRPRQTPACRPRPAWARARGRVRNFSAARTGRGLPPRAPARAPLPGARCLSLPARPPPGRQPTACPRGRQEATCPRKECRAWRAGGGRWAGPGRAGSSPPGRLVRAKSEPAPSPARVRAPAPPLCPARAPRWPDLGISHLPRRIPGRDDPRAPGLGAGRPGHPPTLAPEPPVPASSEEGAGRPVSPHPSQPQPPALGPRPGAERVPSPSCALARPEECPWAWHEDPGAPREGLKPSAVVEGGKRRAGETPLERGGGAGSQGSSPQPATLAPPGPACTCSEQANRA
ncbi:basic proline-rich protein-like [Loxodonta africana]|uniref:basic proline-rich protein-like n=1 Tax=Loxodonta africana TaxID=9785 RepID=UPI0030CC1416